MVVDDSDSLEEGVADDRADEGEPPTPEVLCHFYREVARCGDLGERPPEVFDDRPVGETPDVRGEGAECFGDLKDSSRVLDGARDLPPVPDDAGVSHQLLDLPFAEPGDDRCVEIGEAPSVAGALGKDRAPREAGLGALEHEELEERSVVVIRLPPLGVLVRREKVIDCPPAPGHRLFSRARRRA